MFFQKETSLCERFTKFVLKYDLMTNDTLIVPILESQSNSQSTTKIEKTKDNESEA